MLANLKIVFAHLGLLGTFDLVIRKIARSARYRKMLAAVPTTNYVATLTEFRRSSEAFDRSFERDVVIRRADAMIQDENIFFTFRYHTKGIDRPWEYDPIEGKYWPRRHYSEQILHNQDTPRDVKIVFEINRFKDLPTLGQAALLTSNEDYAIEVQRRILSWIEDNPFASSVNWSSALEISIRLIAWTTTLLLLKEVGFNISDNPKIKRSIYEQVTYLAADLGTDKVLSTNHLIGEAAGLFIVSTLWSFSNSQSYSEIARNILELEILRQTFSDGVTREAASWYHQFATHFFDLASRVAQNEGKPFSNTYLSRLSKMKDFLNSITFKGGLVRYGDADDGWALWMEGDLEAWISHVFSGSQIKQTQPSQPFFTDAEVVASHVKDAFLFLRAGKFGMGGAGFSSHAHDDFLSPIIYLCALPVLADPGTFVYSGDPEKRREYRIATAHNGLIIGNATDAIPRKQFGWIAVRSDASILDTSIATDEAIITLSYGEWPKHKRIVKINSTTAIIEDHFQEQIDQPCEWRLHLAPIWKSENDTSTSVIQNKFNFITEMGDHLTITLIGAFENTSVAQYEFSPSYLVEVPAIMLKLNSSNPDGAFRILITIDRAS
jgi:hypothetical protein